MVHEASSARLEWGIPSYLFGIAVLVLNSFTAPLPAQTFRTLSPLASFGSNGDGSLRPGDRDYITGGSIAPVNSQRGFAFNPRTGNVILVDRAATGSGNANISGGIYVLDGSTGADVHTLSTNGMGGGDFADLAVGVADEGAVYVGNLVNNNTRNFKLYRWDSDSSSHDPILVFDGVPGGAPGPNQRWGDTMDIRGAGANTQIILGSKTFQSVAGTNVVLLTTLDGTNFTAAVLATDSNDNDFGGGIAFGDGNTFWALNAGHPLRHLTFDLQAGIARTLQTYGSNVFPAIANLAPITVDTANHLLAALDIGPGVDHVRLYDISNSDAPPVLLDVKDYAVDNANGSYVGYMDFGGGRLYVHDMNNGLMAFAIDAASATPPEFIAQPTGQRIIAGADAYFEVLADRAFTFQWQRNGTNLFGATNALLILHNVQTTDAGDYQIVVSNSAGSATSTAVALFVKSFEESPHLRLLWSLAPGSRTYLPPDTSATGNTPLYRSLAYHALSNQVLIVSRTAATAGLSINVLDASAGADLYKLNTAGISGGSIILLAIAATEDGAVYAANMSTSANSGAANCKLYRWANSNPSTIPVLVFAGEPAAQTGPVRWGDTLDVRGTGPNTQVFIDANSGSLAALLTPADGTLSNFSSSWIFQSYGPGSIGRSLQFGETNTFWQKRKGLPLELSIYDLDPQSPTFQTSSPLASYSGFPSSMGPVGLSLSRHLLAGINFAGASDQSDTLDAYDIADLDNPLVVARYNFPTNHQPNANFIGQVLIANDRLFALDGNNGILAFVLNAGAPTNPPVITTPPLGQRLLVGGTISLSVFAAGAASYQWQHEGTNIVGATSAFYALANAQFAHAGNYRVVVSNAAGSTTSANASVQIGPPEDYPRLSLLWSLGPESRPYMTFSADANTPFQRSIAYHALSNQVYIINRTSPSDGLSVNVLDAASGADLYQLDTTGISGGSIVLLSIAVGEDGAIYAANMSTSASSGPASYQLYRWANADPTTQPILVYAGEPAAQSAPFRWGDTLAVRGAGTNTQILIDANQGTFAALLTPADSTLTSFLSAGFSQTYGSGSIGRSLEFGDTNTFWQKRKGLPLQWSGYDLKTQNSAVLSNYNNFPGSLGPVGLNKKEHLLAGISFASSTNDFDTLALYEISDLHAPLLLAKYNFPTNHQGNANFIGQTLFADNRIFAVDGNNGIMALRLIPPNPPSPPELYIARTGNDVVISWTNAAMGFILEATSGLPPTSWQNATPPTLPGSNSITESASNGNRFFRLRKP